MKKLILIAGLLIILTSLIGFTAEANPKDASKIDEVKRWLSCTDSDGGLNYSERGIVKAWYKLIGNPVMPRQQPEKVFTIKAIDACAGNWLTEYYCKDVPSSIKNSGNKMLWSTSVRCDYGCRESACRANPCGNGVIDIGENCATCPQDVRCTEGGVCQEGVCVAPREIKLRSTTDRKYWLSWHDGVDNLVRMPLAFVVDGNNITLREDSTDKDLILMEGRHITKDDYIVLTGGSRDRGAKSYLLQYKGADKSLATSPKIKFKNVGSGETLEYAIDTSDTNTVCEIHLGGYTFKVENVTSKTSSDFKILVDLDVTTSVTTEISVPGELLEGESRTYNLNHVPYVVSLGYVDGTYAKFRVNGELTTKLQSEESYALNDGTEIKVLSIVNCERPPPVGAIAP